MYKKLPIFCSLQAVLCGIPLIIITQHRYFCLEKKSNSSPEIVEKHSVVVMHALNRIVETLCSSTTDKGLFFAWSPDGSQIGMYFRHNEGLNLFLLLFVILSRVRMDFSRTLFRTKTRLRNITRKLNRNVNTACT